MTDILSKLKINLILRYSYTGFLLILGLLVFNKAEMLPLIKELNELLVIIFGLTSGAFLYTLYRYIVGEFILYPLVYLIHFFVETATRSEKLNMFSYLKENGIGWYKSRVAYNFIKSKHFKEKLSETINFEHSEIHFVYITALTTITIYILNNLSIANSLLNNLWILISGLVILVCGIVMDIRQHKKEIRILKYEENNSVIKELKTYLNKK